jgi:hypothetical protein
VSGGKWEFSSTVGAAGNDLELTSQMCLCRSTRSSCFPYGAGIPSLFDFLVLSISFLVFKKIFFGRTGV